MKTAQCRYCERTPTAKTGHSSYSFTSHCKIVRRADRRCKRLITGCSAHSSSTGAPHPFEAQHLSCKLFIQDKASLYVQSHLRERWTMGRCSMRCASPITARVGHSCTRRPSRGTRALLWWFSVEEQPSTVWLVCCLPASGRDLSALRRQQHSSTSLNNSTLTRKL